MRKPLPWWLGDLSVFVVGMNFHRLFDGEATKVTLWMTVVSFMAMWALCRFPSVDNRINSWFAKLWWGKSP
jgi:hypothetical protein